MSNLEGERGTLAVTFRHHRLWPWVMAVIGLGIGYRSILTSGFRRMGGHTGDVRLINYILEHSYLWLRGDPLHRSFWESPHFFPASNVVAYTDTLIGVAPIYWSFRLVGFAPDTACQLWALSLLLLAFAAFYLFLRRGFDFDRMSAAFGAALFAFASPRSAQLIHQQLLSHFLTIVALFAVIRIFDGGVGATPRHLRRISARTWIVVFCLASVVQLYASFYLGWFLFLGLLTAALVAMAVERWRRRLITVLSGNAAWIAGCGAASAAVLYPLVSHSAAAASVVGVRSYSAVEPMVPSWAAWTYFGRESLFYGWLAEIGPWRAVMNEAYEHELILGVGFVTGAVVLWGLVSERQNPRIAVAGLAALVIVLCVTRLTDTIAPWSVIFGVVPGAFAIRAVSRVVLLLLIPAGIGLAAFLHRRQSVVLAALMGSVCLGEQLRGLHTFDKLEIRADVAAVAAKIATSRCGYFYLSPRTQAAHNTLKSQLDAMWAALETGVPTVNGYSGYIPPGWDPRLQTNVIRNPQDEYELERALRTWVAHNRLNPAEFCWIR